ncbi:MAG TPA: PAAR-like protein, partial [Polyangiaceae bacterium]|nr:PAAR-like protein [Polyangiaceae bacterium]
MAPQVVAGATAACSFGAAPGSILVLPVHQCLAGSPAANITDLAPIVNVCPFGSCSSLANPAVAAATAAAFGALTPMPCVPVPAGSWLPGTPT